MKKMHLDATGTLLVLLRQTLLLAILFLNLGTVNGNNAGVTGLSGSTRNSIATNSEGTAYGSQASFATQAAPISLQPGDLAVIGLHIGNPTSATSVITVTTLVDLTAGTVIKITDRGWNKNSGEFIPASIANNGEGVVTWTLAGDIPAGTVLKLSITGGVVATTTPGTAVLTNLTTGANLSANVS